MSLIDRLNAEIKIVQSRYPELSDLQIDSNNNYSITGSINLIDSDMKIWETYKILILISSDYPKIVPKVFEIEKKIPSGRHVNGDGSCCLCPNLEEFLILGWNYSLIDFIDKLLIKYLAMQKLFELTGSWMFGEYSHFHEGLIEYYKIKFNTTDIKIVIELLEILCGNKYLKGSSPCLCNPNGRIRFRKCHEKIINDISWIDKKIFINDLQTIKSSLV